MKNKKEAKKRKGRDQGPSNSLKVVTSHSPISTWALSTALTISQLDLGQRANLRHVGMKIH